MKRCPYCSGSFYERTDTTSLSEHLLECAGRRSAKIQFVAAAIGGGFSADAIGWANAVLKELDEGK